MLPLLQGPEEMALRKDDGKGHFGETMVERLNLQLFAEGGSGGGESVGRGTADSGTNGLLSNVRYGRQAEAVTPTSAGGDANAPVQDATRKFEELIKGEYKDAFNQRVQGIINERFKETKALQEFQNDVTPILDTLYTKYGASDVQGLRDAIDNDDSYWEASAEAEGLTVEQFKTKKKLEAENNQFRRMQAEQVREQQAREQYQQWIQDGERVKQAYPQFDLATERKNPQFVDLLKRGIDMQLAFEVIHLNDIKMMSRQARQKAVVNSVRANGLRPSENGVARQSGVITKSDVSKLTKADRAEIARRRERGEHIEF